MLLAGLDLDRQQLPVPDMCTEPAGQLGFKVLLRGIALVRDDSRREP
jgi:hypothetical protein